MEERRERGREKGKENEMQGQNKKQEEKHKRTAIFFTKVIPFFPGGINRVQNITSGNLKSTALKKKKKRKNTINNKWKELRTFLVMNNFDYKISLFFIYPKDRL